MVIMEIKKKCKDCIFPYGLNCTISNQDECHCHRTVDVTLARSSA